MAEMHELLQRLVSIAPGVRVTSWLTQMSTRSPGMTMKLDLHIADLGQFLKALERADPTANDPDFAEVGEELPTNYRQEALDRLGGMLQTHHHVGTGRPPLGTPPDFDRIKQLEKQMHGNAEAYRDVMGKLANLKGLGDAVRNTISHLHPLSLTPELPDTLLECSIQRVIRHHKPLLAEACLYMRDNDSPSYATMLSIEEMERLERERVPEAYGTFTGTPTPPVAERGDAGFYAKAFEVGAQAMADAVALSGFGTDRLAMVRFYRPTGISMPEWVDAGLPGLPPGMRDCLTPNDFEALRRGGEARYVERSLHDASNRLVADPPAYVPAAEDMDAIRKGLAQAEWERDPRNAETIRGIAALNAREDARAREPKLCATCLGVGALNITGKAHMPKCEACNGKGVV